MIGQTISHYKILEKLGEGGMGVVYKAQDTKLDRVVALKFLPHHLTANEAEQARFLQEAKAASSLNHPNICTIHDLQEAGGQQFIVMEYVDGVTLRQKIPMQKLDDCLSFSIQISEALQEAHSKGIVHRDIKAENIMVNTKNQIKVMDFGLAKLKGSLKLTKTSSTVGTLAYMAPEQIQGGEVDVRSDIFAFGVVLFEMIAGRLPFRGEHEAAMVYSIVNEQPESLLKHRPEASAELERIVNRALEKEPEDRYQHVDDMVSELRRVKKQSTRVSRVGIQTKPQQIAEVSQAAEEAVAQEPKKKPRWFALASIAVALIVLCGLGYFIFFTQQKPIDSIAVLPFVNVGADPNTEYLSDGITENIINNLTKLSKLRVVPRSTVFHYKGKDVDPQKAGQELSVRAVLTGKLTQRGDNLNIQTELIDVKEESQLWGEQYNRKISEVLSLQEEISKEIAEKLRLRLSGEEQKELTKHSTENTEAYQLYLKGRFHWNKRKADDLQRAVDYFNQAIDKDPNFALAYAGLASTYALLPEYASLPAKDMIPKTEATAKKASELDPSLAEPHAVLGLIKYGYEWDWPGAEKELKRAIELNPNYPTAYHWFSIYLRKQGKFEEALAEIKRAQELDPLSIVININVGDVLGLMRRYDQAVEQLKKTIELDPNSPGAHQGLGIWYAQQSKFDEALSELLKVREIVGANNPYGLEYLGYIYAKAGKKNEAVKILNQLLQFSKQGKALSGRIAIVYAGLSDIDKAFEWLEKGYLEQDYLLGYLKSEPEWEPLRSDPRYHALLKKIGLEK